MLTLIAYLMIASGCGRTTDGSEGAYNVMLITLDTTRADHLSCYGYKIKTSPNLDALAADAVRFEQAISTSAVTPMSHASILTGLNPYQHGLRVFYGTTGYFLENSVPTLSTVLRSHGWQTGAFISAYPASERFGLHWGFDTFESEVADSVMTQDPTLRPPKDGFWQNKRSGPAQRRADATTDQALEWLAKARRPFFTWIHYFDPHDHSLVPPKAIAKKFGVPMGKRIPVDAVYDPEIYFMDMHLGRIISHLKKIGEYDRTVIVVIADHGQGLGQHGWNAHRLLYQEQIRLPLIVRIPGGPRGKTVSRVVRSIDVMPTILEAVALEPPKPVEGSSLIGLMEDRDEPSRLAYAEALNTIDVHAPRNLPAHQQDDLFCIVDDTWKLIYHKNSPENSELYNLKDDPGEKKNVAAKFTEEAARLAGVLDDSGAMEVKHKEPGEPMDQEALEKLRALGYGK
jgi:arylsulfatase A-like enzyme